MTKIRKIFIGRKLDFYFLLASFVLSASTFILYLITGRTEFVTELSPLVITFYILTLAGSLTLLIFRIEICGYALYLLSFLAWLEYAITQVNYITNIFVAIDNTSLSAAFIMTVVCGALVWMTALASAILLSFSKKRDAAEKQNGEAI